MAEKFSSPSSSSNAASLGTPQKGRAGSEEDVAYLAIRKQPPSYVFPDEVFEIDFVLEAARGSQNSPPTNVTIQAVLQRARHCSESIQATLNVLEEPRVSPSRRTGKVRCKIECSSQISRKQNAAFSITISTNTENITPVTTTVVHLVNAKIRVAPSSDWNDIWYKDEGGREKCMEVSVEVHDRNDQLLFETIPLDVTLCYDTKDNIKVMNQNILRMLGTDRKLQIGRATGRGIIRFRIEDVSKNHQGQDFVLEITANKNSFLDIAPGYTPPVNVRSKRNKRQRSSIPGAGGRRVAASLDVDRPRPSPVNVPGAAFADLSLQGLEANALREAIQGVTQWADEVVNGLYPLQWHILGYAQHPDGTPDYSRPYHNMPNPNPVISRVLSTYSETTQNQLRLLEQAVSRSTAAAAAAAATMQSREEIPMHTVPSSMPEFPETFALLAQTQLGQPPLDLRQDPRQGVRQRVQDFREFQGSLPGLYPPRLPQPPQAAPRLEEPEPLQLPHLGGGPPVAVVDAAAAAAPVAEPEDTNRESEVEYVLAKQFKSVRTGERLGFPAYSASKELLGFYRESGSKVGTGQFDPISRYAEDFGPAEILQASQILQEAIDSKSEAVHALRDWGTIGNLIDHALVYDWSKDIGGGASNNTSSGASELGE